MEQHNPRREYEYIAISEDVAARLHEPLGLIDEIWQIEYAHFESNTAISDEEISEVSATFGEAYLQTNKPCYIDATGYRYDDGTVSGQPMTITGDDYFVVGFDRHMLDQWERIIMIVARGPLETDSATEIRQYNELYAVLPDKIVNLDMDISVDAYPVTSQYINQMQQLLHSPAYVKMAPDERRAAINDILLNAEQELHTVCASRPIAAICDEYYGIDHTDADQSLPSTASWKSYKFPPDASVDRWPSGDIVIVALPELLRYFESNERLSPSSFRVSRGCPWLVLNNSAEGQLYFIPFDQLHGFIPVE